MGQDVEGIFMHLVYNGVAPCHISVGSQLTAHTSSKIRGQVSAATNYQDYLYAGKLRNFAIQICTKINFNNGNNIIIGPRVNASSSSVLSFMKRFTDVKAG